MTTRQTRAQVRAAAQAQAMPNLEINTNLTFAPRPMGDQAQREWLLRSANWPDMNPITTHRRWRPRKVLGSGASGLVGLWDFVGREPPVAHDNTPAQIAVKQSAGLDARMKLQWESKLLQQINGARSEHVVKIYKGFHLDGGTGTEASRDPIPYNDDGNYNEDLLVARIYLEYCQGGDLGGLINERDDGDFTVPEEQLWRIMLCIFKGLLVLEQGSEIWRGPPFAPAPWLGEPIAHFDIKPGNILIGSRTADGEHQTLEPFKLTDFGLALPVPPLVVGPDPLAGRKDRQWIREAEWRATEEYMPPEQFYSAHEVRDLITHQTGIWSAAAIIVELITGHRINIRQCCSHPTTGRLSVCPPDLFNGARYGYSGRLISLLCECLYFEPDQRPTIARVVQIAQGVVREFDDDNEAYGVEVNENSLRSGNEPNIILGPVQHFSKPTETWLHYMEREHIGVSGDPARRPQPGGPARGAPPFFLGNVPRLPNPVLEQYPFIPLVGVQPALRGRGRGGGRGRGRGRGRRRARARVRDGGSGRGSGGGSSGSSGGGSGGSGGGGRGRGGGRGGVARDAPQPVKARTRGGRAPRK